jgi:hypothetical protein
LRENPVFQFATFKRNISRLKAIKEDLAEFNREIQAVLQWEDPFKTSYALVTYVMAVWYMELWMAPLLPIFVITFHILRRKPKARDDWREEEDEVMDGIPKEEDVVKEVGVEEGEKGEGWGITRKLREVPEKAVWVQVLQRREMMMSLMLVCRR